MEEDKKTKRPRKKSSIFLEYLPKGPKRPLTSNQQKMYDMAERGCVFDDFVREAKTYGERPIEKILMMRFWTISKRGYKISAPSRESKIEIT